MSFPYAGNPANYPAAITLMTDGTDTPSFTNFNTGYEGLADRTAYLFSALLSSAVGQFRPQLGTIRDPSNSINITLDTACWDPFLHRWTALFYGGGNAYAFDTHSSGDVWSNLNATPLSANGVLTCAADGFGDAVFVLQTGVSSTDIVNVAFNGAFNQTNQPFLNLLAQATILRIPGLYFLLGCEQSGGVFTGHLASSASGVGLWSDGSASLPAAWAGGTNHVAGYVSGFDVGGTSTYPIVFGMCGISPGTDVSRLLSFVAGVPTDITPAFLTGKSLTGLAYNAATKTWGILCYTNAGAFLYTSPDQATWTLAHTFSTGTGGAGKTGGLAVVGSLWAAQLTGVDGGSGTTDNDRVMLSPDNGVTWSSAAYAMAGDAVGGIHHFPRLLSSGNQLMAFNNGFHDFSNQAGLLPAGAY